MTVANIPKCPYCGHLHYIKPVGLEALLCGGCGKWFNSMAFTRGLFATVKSCFLNDLIHHFKDFRKGVLKCAECGFISPKVLTINDIKEQDFVDDNDDDEIMQDCCWTCEMFSHEHQFCCIHQVIINYALCNEKCEFYQNLYTWRYRWRYV